METNDLDKILKKSYEELSPQERESIRELCASAEEFVHLQQVFASVEEFARESFDASEPLPETKEKLDHLFYQTYQQKGVLWYNAVWMSLYPREKAWHQTPLVRAAAVLVLLIALIPLWPSRTVLKPESPLLAKNEAPVSSAPAKQETERTTDEAEANAPSASDVPKKTSLLPVRAKAYSRSLKVNASPEKKEADVEYAFSSGWSASPASVSVSGVVSTFSADDAPADMATFVHPDGVFKDFDMEKERAAVYSLRANADVLDLLTPTF